MMILLGSEQIELCLIASSLLCLPELCRPVAFDGWIDGQIENFEKILNKSALEIENNDISVDEITKLNFNNFDLLW